MKGERDAKLVTVFVNTSDLALPIHLAHDDINLTFFSRKHSIFQL